MRHIKMLNGQEVEVTPEQAGAPPREPRPKEPAPTPSGARVWTPDEIASALRAH